MRGACLLLAGLMAALTVLPVLAQQEEARSTISAIEVRNRGAGQIDRSYIESHTSVREGDDLDRASIGRDVRNLLDTGRFSAVHADIEAREDGVVLVYVVARKLTLARPVTFTGSDHLPPRKLRSLLELEVGERVDEHTLGVHVRAIREAFIDDHYPNVSITWEINEIDRDQGLAEVRVHIESGARSKVKTVRFEGNERIGYSDLRSAIRRPSPWSPMWLFRKRRYSSDEMEGMRLAVRNLYRERGFLDVEVEYPAVELDRKGRQTVVVRIHEGETYRFDSVKVTGVDLFPHAEVEALVVARPGVTASSRIIQASAQRIRDFYGSRGYARARVRPLLEAKPALNVVAVTFDVVEGDLIRVGNIRIRGNTRTRDKVIRRELLLNPGDVLNSVRARRSERRLMNLGYFSAVRRHEQETSVPNREDVIFEVEEKRTGQFLVGAGFSSIDNIIGFVEISQGNFDIRGWPFTGGGQKLNLRGQFGSERRDYKLSFVEPWFLNRKLSLGLDAYRTDLNYTDYDLKRTGAAVSLSKALPGANRISFRYSLEETEITDVADTNEYVYAGSPDEIYNFLREEDTLKSTLRTTLTHDTRNNPFIPTRGLRASVFGRISGGPLGFDTDVYGLGVRTAFYVPLWWDHVLSIKGRYETVDGYGDTEEVPISERLFAGGGRTIRGFDYRDVGPKVVPTDPSSAIRYRPVGGQSLAVANLEYTIPLVDGVRLAAFYDIGGVWRDAYEFNADNLASGTGVGLRLDMPGFPIRIDRAWSVEADDELTDTDNWVIWIGYDY
ncbi:MAG: outer membrane protein assembly factor BamA [Kiritimatiellia bacterium]|jgi:outer membrane protein insertion porin family|nr:outer membrane protein assembly factor BamA [Kiritimatiellia bacterium]MDP7023263.1 outer membrane protein assembly factor BamA [Kiritimatiellia bacterium]